MTDKQWRPWILFMGIAFGIEIGRVIERLFH